MRLKLAPRSSLKVRVTPGLASPLGAFGAQLAATETEAEAEALFVGIGFNEFIGDSGGGGQEGLVPAPAAGDSAANKYLHANGSFKQPIASEISGVSSFGASLVDDTDASTARTTLGLVIGTNVQAYDAELTAIAGLTSAANKVPYFTGSGTAAVADFSAFGRTLVDDADASTARTTLGVAIGTDVAAQVHTHTSSSITDFAEAAQDAVGATFTPTSTITLAYDDSLNTMTASVIGGSIGNVHLVDMDQSTIKGRAAGAGTGDPTDLSASQVRTLLDLVVGTNVQAYDAELAALAGLTSAADKGIQFTGSGTAATYDLTAAGKALLDDADASAQRTTLGLAIGTDVQAYDADLAAIAANSTNGILARTGAGTVSARTLTAPAAGITVTNGDGVSGNPTLVLANDLASLEAASGTNTIYYRSASDTWSAVTIGTNLTFSGGTLAASGTGTGDVVAANNGSEYTATQSTFRANLGLTIGTHVQAYDAELAALAGLTSAADKGIQFTGTGTAATYDLTAAGKALLDDADASAQRTTLGLGSAAVLTAGTSANNAVQLDGTGKLPAVDGSQLTGIQAGRTLLTANRTYYVRTDGNDSNTGLANTSGGAFLTIQKAADVVAALDISIYDVTISVGAGTYTGAVSLKTLVGSGTASIVGDVTTPSNVVISTTSATCISVPSPAGRWRISGLKLQTTTSGFCIDVSSGGSLTVNGNMTFGAVPAYHVVVQTGGTLAIVSSYSISAGAPSHLYILSGGILLYTPTTVTAVGSLAFTTFAQTLSLAQISTAGTTFSGTYTGKRYDAAGNSIINTFGSGSTYFPGDAAGTETTGGRYL